MLFSVTCALGVETALIWETDTRSEEVRSLGSSGEKANHSIKRQVV